MNTLKQVPGLGTARLDHGCLAYRLAEPLTIDEVAGLLRETWCRRLTVSDASADGERPAEFRALCELDGEPFVLVGRIGEGT
ncbi:hypothetical protein J5Y04_23045 [Kitasatospora sp. RG8]|uniref:hypothetical protein n=1 Tax=Kitasatospora sp. RG8 TaxID=2820815 RepID=UPI001ADEEDAD|nr:hypothetical protein [Kitasatospora sp. RG8]MBP0452398.1 hypothetical protein [Kitasatospora sp. RG8]